MQVRVPEVVYTSLTDYLSDISAIETIKSRGSLIVRDVIPDSVALGWAKEITTAEEIRSGDSELPLSKIIYMDRS